MTEVYLTNKGAKLINEKGDHSILDNLVVNFSYALDLNLDEDSMKRMEKALNEENE